MFNIPLFLCAVLLVAGMAAPAHANAPPKKGKTTLSMAGESYYVNMTPMVLPVVNERGIREVVSMVIALEIKDADNMDKVNSLVPRLNDAYMRALYGKLSSAVFRSGEFLDVNKLKTRLLTVTDSVVGKGKVNDVLIEGVNQRQYN